MANILVVDDDPDIRAAMRSLLEDFGGHVVREAEDGLAALTTLRAAQGPEIVLLDLLMPKLGGLGVLRAAAADERLASRNAYVLVTVAREVLLTEVALGLARPVPVVQKPFDIETLLAAVDAASEELARRAI